MNKLFFIAVMAITTLSFTSCGTYNSARDSYAAKSAISTDLLTKIAPVLIQDIGKSILPKAGSTDMLSKITMATKIKSLIKGDDMVNSFKNMISGNYGIASDKVDSAYSGFKTLKDVATFVGLNASPSFLSSL